MYDMMKMRSQENTFIFRQDPAQKREVGEGEEQQEVLIMEAVRFGFAVFYSTDLQKTISSS